MSRRGQAFLASYIVLSCVFTLVSLLSPFFYSFPLLLVFIKFFLNLFIYLYFQYWVCVYGLRPFASLRIVNKLSCFPCFHHFFYLSYLIRFFCASKKKKLTNHKPAFPPVFSSPVVHVLFLRAISPLHLHHCWFFPATPIIVTASFCLSLLFSPEEAELVKCCPSLFPTGHSSRPARSCCNNVTIM